MLTVVEPATSRNLTTLAAVWSDIGIATGPDDAYLSTVIAQASDAVATWCGRDIGVQGYVETFRDSFGDVLLSAFPIVEVSSVTVDGTAVDLTAVSIDSRNGIVGMPRRGLCRHHRGDVVVTYSAGYVLPDAEAPEVRTLPNDIERAALLLVKGAYMARSRDPAVRTEDVPGVASISYGLAGIGNGAQLPPDVEGLLQRYRAVTSG